MKIRDDLRIETCFKILEECALKGDRVPENGTNGMVSYDVMELVRAGRVRVLISGANFRTVEILTGDCAGMKTAQNPKGHRVWKTIDKAGTRIDRGAGPEPSKRPARRSYDHQRRMITDFA